MFRELEVAPPDPILGLTEAFLKDTNPDKINLSVGVFKNEDGVTPILKCVKQAERRLLDEESSKGYLPITGSAAYDQAAIELLFGADHAFVKDGRAQAAQTPGGTGALRVAADFIHRRNPNGRIWVSKPTWANHANIFAAAGVQIAEYAYLDDTGKGLDFDAMLRDLQAVPAGEVVLLHGCCHNPTGVDPTVEQWRELSQVVKTRRLLPFVDFAYQGFAEGLETDAQGLRVVSQHVGEMLIASSYSKNFGLYSERVGALTVVGDDPRSTGAALSHVKSCIRANYSNPPAHGAEIVRLILNDAVLREQWQQELREMRDRINGMRSLFVSTMRGCVPNRDFSFINRQRGMFSFSGLTADQVQRLRDENSIYIVGSGRINVAGITSSNVQRLGDAIAAVL